MKKVGFFGGCFNPITIAHVNLIKNVIEQENLEKVYFVPMGDFYAKKDLIGQEHRLKMIELAIENEDKMDILKLSNQDKKMYAIDSFKLIDEKFPEVDRFFIMGSDNYQKISSWRNPDELKQYQYIVLNREQGELKNISSSEVRERIKQNKNVDNMLPSQVLEYIEQKNLYR